MENHILTELTNMEQLAILRLERIQELDQEMAEREAANKHILEEMDIDLDNKIADLKRRRDALLAAGLEGATP